MRCYRLKAKHEQQSESHPSSWDSDSGRSQRSSQFNRKIVLQYLSHELRDRVDRVCEWGVFDLECHKESVTFRRERFLNAPVVGSPCLHDGLVRVLGSH